MNKLLIVVGVVSVILLVGYLFVRWANQPENVEALQRYRVEKQRKKALQDSLAQAAALAEAQLQQLTAADLQLVLTEDFKGNHFNALQDFKEQHVSIKDNKLVFYDALVTPKQMRNLVLGLSHETVRNFVAELHFEKKEGCGIATGIIFNAEATTDGSFSGNMATVGDYATAYIDGTERASLAEDLRNAKQFVVRFQKKGKQFSIQVNQKVVLEQTVEQYKRDSGKIGLYIDYFNQNKDFNRSATTTITLFKVWKW